MMAPKEFLPVGRMEKDPEKLKLAYRMGYDRAKEEIARIREFLL